jgi:hypothetical protein
MLELDDPHISELLTKKRRRELINGVNKAPNSQSPVIVTKIKSKQSRSSRGSDFRGVSKNGKKWQVR